VAQMVMIKIIHFLLIMRKKLGLWERVLNHWKQLQLHSLHDILSLLMKME